jgi:4-hydroxythreonine-4-phosphate dehydrogenase
VPASLRIAVTVGDPAGIGPEVVWEALHSDALVKDCVFEVVGAKEAAQPGHPTEAGARSAFEALESAASGLLEGRYAAVVTGPIHKARMRKVGFLFPGQTEFFAHRSQTLDYTMCLTGGPLTVALVTAHVPYREVPESLSPRAILRTGLQLADFLALRLRQSGKKSVPRIAVAGLNPHAGEEGLLGGEEAALISPCVQQLNTDGRAVFSGPLSPDTVFYRAAQGEFDGVICMYHDQGLIPLKLLAFHEGVNVTLGLPFPRTSPDHGTAFEIAGQGKAHAGSMLAALNLAAELALKGRFPLP